MNCKKLFFVFLLCSIMSNQNIKAFNATEIFSVTNISKTLDNNPWTMVMAGMALLWYVVNQITDDDKALAD